MAKITDFPAVKIPKKILDKKVGQLSIKDLKAIENGISRAQRGGGGPPGLCTCCSSS